MPLIAITPDEFNPDVHELPVAGELLLAGVTAVIHLDGIAYIRTAGDAESLPQGYVIEVSKPGDVVEITAQETDEIDGGIFINKFWVLIE
jgi:hypothetical protein